MVGVVVRCALLRVSIYMIIELENLKMIYMYMYFQFYVRLTEAETKNVRHGFPELEPFVDSQDTQGPLFPQRLSSMYVDEWTNAYEVVKNVYGEKKCVMVLMEWLEVRLFYCNSLNCTKLMTCIYYFILIYLPGTAPTVPSY